MAIKEINYQDKKYIISYEIKNSNKKRDIVFLHGWGSNKELMSSVFGLYLPDYRHIYIDLPGFGKSSNDNILTTKDYANIVNSFLQILDSDYFILVGHSFGGKVATLLNPKNLVLLSSAGIVEAKPLSVKIKIFLAKLLGKLGLGEFTRAFRTKDASNLPQNMYETLKNVVNEDFSKNFIDYSGFALVFWGDKDRATSIESGKKISKLIKNSKFFSYEGDHYFFLKNAKTITGVISSNVMD